MLMSVFASACVSGEVREGIVSEFLEDVGVAGNHYVTDGTLLADQIHFL